MSFCECGCGRRVGTWAEGSKERGRVKGESKRFIRGHNGRVLLEKRFWLKVRLGEKCWSWVGSKNVTGYGLIQTGTHDYPVSSLAHRISWEINVGPIPGGLCVLHACDNPECTRPSHLFLGTHQDNMTDMKAKGRSGPSQHPERMPRGSASGMARLTEVDIPKIRQLLSNGTPDRRVALAFGVSRSAIRCIRIGETWRHV